MRLNSAAPPEACHVCFRAQRSPVSAYPKVHLETKWPRDALSPLRRVLERSAQTLPASSPLQDIVLTAQIHTNPETSLERLVPLVEFLTAWKLLPNISHRVLQTIEKGYQIQFGSRPPRFMGVLSTEVAPQQVLVMETGHNRK